MSLSGGPVGSDGSDGPTEFRFWYDAFYKFYAARADDASLFESADGAVGAYLYSAKRHRNGLVREFVSRKVATARRAKDDPADHAHGLYFMCLASDSRRRLWWVYPEPCVNRATGETDPYLVGNHLSFVYDRTQSEKSVRLHTTAYFVNENEDPDVVHVHDPFEDGAIVSASGPPAEFVKKNRARAPLIIDIIRRPFVGSLSRLGGAREPGENKRRAQQSKRLQRESVEGRMTPPAAAARAALVAACNRAFGGLDGFTAIGVRQTDGSWTHSVELQLIAHDWPISLKPPTYIVRSRAAGSITFERAFARLLNAGPTLAERLREHEHTSR